ncbi:MAG: HGGxSTG domain-containing protein [Alphaproteobacteria bacterium]
MPVNIQTLRKCGAKAKRTHKPCKQPAMKNGRCRLHGGKSTGPKTRKGIERIQSANYRHGRYSLLVKELNRFWRQHVAPHWKEDSPL